MADTIPSVEGFFHEPTFSVTYLVWDPATLEAAVIDPVLDFDAKAARTGTKFIDGVIARAKALKLSLRWVLETHVHADHLTAAPLVRQRLGGVIAIGRDAVTVQRTFKPLFAAADLVPDGSQFDRLVADGERLPLGGLEIEVLATPGHTPACVTYHIGDAAFIGDTLFMPDYGTARADFPGGDAAQLFRSIQRILALPPETRLFLCHDYKAPGRDSFVWETTVAAERAGNIHLKNGVGEEAFATFRRERDKTLSTPALIIPALQVNIRAGQLPPAADDGTVYLQMPLNKL